MNKDRFKFIKGSSFLFKGDLQEHIILWDYEVNSFFSLDRSYIEQNDYFTHPYTGEKIFFDLYSAFSDEA